jgi:hypothetical protein
MKINGKESFPYSTKKEFYENVDKTPYEAPTNAYNLNKLGRFCDRYKLECYDK